VRSRRNTPRGCEDSTRASNTCAFNAQSFEWRLG
jgi:hypothetical protein